MIALLDTNAYAAAARGDEPLLENLGRASHTLMSSIVVGELEYGFRHGTRYQQNRHQLDEFLAESYVDFLTISRDTSIHYGLISSELRAGGNKIPSNDAWIAAHAREYSAVLWTRDRHFQVVTGVSTRQW